MKNRSSEKIPLSLYVIVFLSGASALIFENLWFRLAGLTFGNDVWASTMVLSGFMGGLAVGNALATRYGNRFRFPIRLYALAESLVAVGGLALVLIFPSLTSMFIPLFRPFLEQPYILNSLRLSLVFCLLLIPTTAMGVTLPLLVKALATGAKQGNFGQALGRAYGWNTAGAVVGALATDAVLVANLGIWISGIVAASCNIFAALGALYLSSGVPPRGEKEPDMAIIKSRLSRRAFRIPRLLLAGFLAGGTLLAFEVVWFRFLLLYVQSTSLMFSIMLGVVLLGIALGGLAAAGWIRRHKQACRFLPVIAGLCVIITVLSYSGFLEIAVLKESFPSPGWYYLSLALYLILPVSLLSGVLFTLIGESLHQEIGGAATTTGLLTVFNTVGSMLGAALAGFVLLPVAGIEMSYFILILAYIVVGVLTLEGFKTFSRNRGAYLLHMTALICVLSVLLFPKGTIKDHYNAVNIGMTGTQDKLEAVREGLTETIRYFRHDYLGKPFYYRMLTNSYSMSGTHYTARRYMKMFVYLPVAVHPNMKDALLICFGVGATAKALTDTRSLESIDIVDISRDIVEMSSVVFPNDRDNPIYDPRVKVHIQDGRFFMQTTSKRYDLITGEPPPLRVPGCANLYSREYFQILYECLKEGGIVTYWLPVYQLDREDFYGIVKAFSDVFTDATLWSGSGYEWILVGTRNAGGPVSEDKFKRQWQDPVVADELMTLGLELPEQLGATFLLDTPSLLEMTKDALPLTDNYPKRLKDHGFRDMQDYADVPSIAVTESQRQFVQSAFIQRVWPDTMRLKTQSYFQYQPMIDEYLSAGLFGPSQLVKWLQYVNKISEHSSLYVLPLWLMDSSIEQQKIVDQLMAENNTDFTTNMIYQKSIQLAAVGRYAEAEHHFARLQQSSSNVPHFAYIRIFLLAMAGELEGARELTHEFDDYFSQDRDTAYEFWSWMTDAFDLDPPASLSTGGQ